MQLFRLDAATGRAITQYNSQHLTLNRLARATAPLSVALMHLAPGGEVGYHQAAAPQLFCVVQGEGWVQGQAPPRQPIRAGQAAYWGAGEWHAAGTGTGLAAVVLEGEGLDPALWPPL